MSTQLVASGGSPVHPFLSPSLSPFPAPWVSLTWLLYPNFLGSCSASRARVPSVISSSCLAWEVTGESLCCISLLEAIITTAPQIQRGGHRWRLLLGECEHIGAASVFLCHLPEEGERKRLLASALGQSSLRSMDTLSCQGGEGREVEQKG